MNEMKIYSRILLQTCIVDIIVIFVFAVVQPVFVSDNGIGTVWEYGPTHYLPTPWQCICFMIFAFITRFTTMNVCSQFVFRYLTVVREIKINWKHHIIILFSFTLPLLVNFVISIIIHQPTKENEHLTNYELAKMLELDNDTINNYVVGFRGQALLPLLTFSSQILINMGRFFNINISSKIVMMFGSPMTALIAVLNPLVTLLTVKNYRKLVFKCNRGNITNIIGNNNQTAHTAFSNRNVIVPLGNL
uniref:G_PROTEIN_RECEP_F1_2 domain-containing protein n=2 Tax=Meloidogyne hapla TaxID=6305 RepID=A0A1I8BCP9_MELHA